VRTAREKPDRPNYEPSLIIRPDDMGNEDFPFMLVTKNPATGRFQVCGWIYGRDATRLGEWKDPDGRGHAWFVPQSVLRDPDELRSIVHIALAFKRHIGLSGKPTQP
jgi:hypothetical protein